MKKLSLAFVLLAFALYGCGVKKLTLAEVRNPTAGTLNESIVTQGYFSSSDQQDLLTGEQDRYVDMVDLSLFPGVSTEQRRTKRMELASRLGGKLVTVSGILKVGPYGLAGRSTVYIEVQSIAAATPTPQ